MQPVLVIVGAYLLGSIPFGYLIVRTTEGADVRQTGSGGTGATNVSRRAGKVAGLITLVLDALKGAMAVGLAKAILGLPIFGDGGHMAQVPQNVYWWVAVAAIAVIVGHIFPVWLGFRGGKGVATGVGVFLMLSPIAVAFAGATFMVIVLATRYVSLGSMVAAATIPVFLVFQNIIRPSIELAPTITAATTGAALIVFAHRENIERLIKGTESRFK